MLARKLTVSLVSASLIAVPVQRVQADEAAAALGGLILGGIIVNEINKSNQRKQQAAQQQANQQRRTTNPGISSAQREQNRQVQTSLNYFGYNVGVVDGSIGRKTRAGIARYQSEMGFPADGRLDDYERDFLLSSYQRALASAHLPPYNGILASQGRAGLLRTYRNEQLGIATTAPAPAPAPTAPKSVPAKAEAGVLPDFTFGKVDRSLNGLCNEINALTAANGGLTGASAVTDAEFALNEQFCLARTHAMADSARIEATIPNMTSAQVESQCKGLAQAIAPKMSAIGTSRPDMVIADTSAFLKESGKPMDQLVSGGKVCLGVGYRIDDPDMALASAVLLASAGQLGYGEIVSHHLREGLGTGQTTADQAAPWMMLALNAANGGGDQVLGQSPDRIAVLRAATQGGGAQKAALPAFPTTSGN